MLLSPRRLFVPRAPSRSLPTRIARADLRPLLLPLSHLHRRRPSVRVRYTESPRGSRKAVDCRQPRQTAHRSHALSLSLIAYSPTGSPTGATSSPPLEPLFSPFLPTPSLLPQPLLHTLCLVARPESQPATRDPPVTQQ